MNLGFADSDAFLEEVPPGPKALQADHPARRVQVIEVAIFLLLIVPSMSTSFLIGHRSQMGFVTAAVLSILNDIGWLALILYFIWRNGESLRRLGWTSERLGRELFTGLLLFFPAIFGVNALDRALHEAGLSSPSKLPSFLLATGHFKLALAVLLVIVVAVVEETIFRGYLILRLQSATRSPWAAVLLSSSVFALGHGYEGTAGVLSIFCLGAVLALIYLWRKSLIAPMIIHFLIDFSGIVLAGLQKPG